MGAEGEGLEVEEAEGVEGVRGVGGALVEEGEVVDGVDIVSASFP